MFIPFYIEIEDVLFFITNDIIAQLGNALGNSLLVFCFVPLAFRISDRDTRYTRFSPLDKSYFPKIIERICCCWIAGKVGARLTWRLSLLEGGFFVP